LPKEHRHFVVLASRYVPFGRRATDSSLQAFRIPLQLFQAAFRARSRLKRRRSALSANGSHHTASPKTCFSCFPSQPAVSRLGHAFILACCTSHPAVRLPLLLAIAQGSSVHTCNRRDRHHVLDEVLVVDPSSHRRLDAHHLPATGTVKSEPYPVQHHSPKRLIL